MTISQTLYVLEVASCQSISKAAERLYVSQSAISQQLLKLEAELGYCLFTRTIHGLELTAAGERFCIEGRPVVDAWQAFCKSVQANNPEAKKQIRIGMGSRVYSNGLFSSIVHFFDAHPDIEVSFVTEAGADFLSALRQQSIDLALDVLPSEDYLDERGEFYSCVLIREPQCVLMAKGDERASLPSLSFQQLQGSTMISGLEYSSEARMLKSLCRKNDITLDRIYRSDGIETVMNLVRDGRGIILGPRSFAEYYHVAAVPLEPKTIASLRFLCLDSLIHRREIREFRDHLLTLTKDRGLPE